jgi:hypothetical protein
VNYEINSEIYKVNGIPHSLEQEEVIVKRVSYLDIFRAKYILARFVY